MVKAKIVVGFDEIVWVSNNGKVCEKKELRGLKVTRGILFPDCFLVTDELSVSTRQKGGGHVGGTFLLCKKGPVSKQISLQNQNN